MKFSRTYEVRFSEADRRHCITPVALYNYLQETAVNHGESAHKSRYELHDRGFAWIINRILIQFIRYPKRYDSVTVTTWASTLTGLYAVREWTAEDQDGNICAHATSRWVLLDIHKRRAVRLPSFIAADYGIDDGIAAIVNVDAGAADSRLEIRHHFRRDQGIQITRAASCPAGALNVFFQELGGKLTLIGTSVFT